MKTLLECASEDQKTIEELKTIVETMLLNFFRKVLTKINSFKQEELLNKISEIISQYKIIIDYECLVPNSAVCDMKNKNITYYQQFFHAKRIEKIASMIHEYMHAISRELAGISKYDVLEEGFADLLSEICINNCLIDDTLDDKSKKENPDLKQGYTQSRKYGYTNCRELVKTIFAALAIKNKDIEGITTFCLLDKNVFDQLCIDCIGNKYAEFLKTIQYVSINSELDNSSLVMKESRTMLLMACNDIFNSMDIRKLIRANMRGMQSFNSIYHFNNTLMKEFILKKIIVELKDYNEGTKDFVCTEWKFRKSEHQKFMNDVSNKIYSPIESKLNDRGGVR